MPTLYWCPHQVLKATGAPVEDLYLNLKQCILILLKKYTIWSIIWSFCYWKKEIYLVKSQLCASIDWKVSAAVPNFRKKLFRTVGLRDSLLLTSSHFGGNSFANIFFDSLNLESRMSGFQIYQGSAWVLSELSALFTNFLWESFKADFQANPSDIK